MFGGDTLTATDLAVAAGPGRDRRPVPRRPPRPRPRARRRSPGSPAGSPRTVDRMRTSPDRCPSYRSAAAACSSAGRAARVADVRRPEHFAVANAVGAAIAQVGGEVDRVFADRPRAPRRRGGRARAEAVERAESGRRPTGHGRDRRRRGDAARLPSRRRDADPGEGRRRPRSLEASRSRELEIARLGRHRPRRPGILGSGGGGDPYIGRLLAERAIRAYGPVTVVDIAEVPPTRRRRGRVDGRAAVSVESFPRGPRRSRHCGRWRRSWASRRPTWCRSRSAGSTR